jgi:hypothetical protein
MGTAFTQKAMSRIGQTAEPQTPEFVRHAMIEETIME